MEYRGNKCVWNIKGDKYKYMFMNFNVNGNKCIKEDKCI
jgi:hypothetical protein